MYTVQARSKICPCVPPCTLAALGTFCDVVFNECVFETGMIILDKNRLCINKMFTKY